MNKPIYVTQPSLAPLEEVNEYLRQIWESGIMTHNGPLMQRLEKEVSEYEGVPDTICLANGTCAMQLAIRALDLEGEIITTPFTFIATANVIAWERCTPVFVDIDPDTWNIDPDKIEDAISDKTVAVLPVHVFSAPCDVARIQQIAGEHGLKVIYDAAHAMCVKLNGKSIMSYGDVSCTSFHATKLFNTCEGGACFTENKELASRIRKMRFFGFDEMKEIVDDGINAKMTEIAAGLGLANLRYLDEVRKKRRDKYEFYRSLLDSCGFISFQKYDPEEYNYSYMPILFDSEERLLCKLEQLANAKIYPRRYFYPSLNNIELFSHPKLPVANAVAKRIACLPLYNKLSDSSIRTICSVLLENG
ncbi:DegT/DnrJ/EryC1/StrS family aminotransferase [Pontiella sulfatireligans]|uniref:dTDP-4-amino-4,6-dideoxy-D-glucose transaminase n=1 Tax=Pontiella sulfatireligans TaxID=2750658 RepID=A0A6C2UDJ8_9BACT|nr:DegT/DnrJ/EryC1/StrS family aminotransferase [Pontiella sulfatireligans]VGO18268.1 dTDP-4-amino-4,6-dideoxy-D-glucose transaminase [Pontiella sulfatireligans]